MKLSVITICYNIKDEIERTCESIAAQTTQDFEWIVVDGGSTDGTVDILNKYKDKMSVFISEPDKGIYNAMNKGIKKATGEYLNFMNGGDCFAANDVIEKFYQCSAYGADVVYGKMNVMNKNKKIYTLTYPQKVDELFFFYTSIGHQSSFIKKGLFDKYGPYNENYKIASDWEKWVIFSKNKCSFVYTDNVIANFDDSGISNTNRKLSLEERDRIQHEIYTRDELVERKRWLSPKYNISLFNVLPIMTIDCHTIKQKKTYKLFGFLPIYKIKKNENQSKHYLFGFIPFLKIKEK